MLSVNTQINGKFLYVHSEGTRECRYCHGECERGCTGPGEHECAECANYFVGTRGGRKCVDKCPASHYAGGSGGRECLPCYKDCYGCSGPGRTLGAGACSRCSSALVDNDEALSVLECVEMEALNCSGAAGQFSMLVPEGMDHPLRGKKVLGFCLVCVWAVVNRFEIV